MDYSLPWDEQAQNDRIERKLRVLTVGVMVATGGLWATAGVLLVKVFLF